MSAFIRSAAVMGLIGFSSLERYQQRLKKPTSPELPRVEKSMAVESIEPGGANPFAAPQQKVLNLMTHCGRCR
jgi:hypothetical protein